MASILILGPSRLVHTFLQTLSGSHTIFTLGPDSIPGATQLAGAADIPETVDCAIELAHDPAEKLRNLQLLAGAMTGGSILFTNALASTATATAALLPAGITVIGISWVPGLSNSAFLEAAPALGNSADGTSSALDLLRSITGAELEIVVDRVGLVSARMMAMIINEAMFAMMEGVATPADIDVAMKLGTNYPEGPLAWADRIGADIILHILDALLDEYREERYRPCVLLRQFVRAGRPVHEGNAA